MYFCGFQLFHSRGEALSGWIPTEPLTTMISTDAAGMNGLLRSLFEFHLQSPQSGRVKTREADSGSVSDTEIACKAKYHLFRKEELEAFFWAAYPGAERGTDGFEAHSGIPLPKSQGVLVSRTGAGEYLAEFEPPLADGLDSALATAWIKRNLPPCVFIDGHSLFSGHADLSRIAEKIDGSLADDQPLTAEERTTLALLTLADLDFKDFLPERAGKPRASQSARLARASARLNQLDFPCPEGAVRFDLRIDGNSLDVFVEDLVRGEVLPLRACSPWLRWIVSFLSQAAGAMAGDQRDGIFLMDSLGPHLYAGHHDALLSFFERLSKSNSILYTTQMPSMVDLSRPRQLLALAPDPGLKGLKAVPLRDPAAPQLLLQQALGMDRETVDATKGGPALLVADTFTAAVLRALSGAMSRAGSEPLSHRIHLQSSGGLPRFLLAARFAAGQWGPLAFLLNTDASGETLLTALEEALLPKKGAGTEARLSPLMIGEAAAIEQNEATIEDLFPVEFFLDCVSSAYGAKIGPKDLPDEGSDSLGKRLATAARRLGIEEKKTELLLPEIERRLGAVHAKADFPPGTYEKAKSLFSRVNSALGLRPRPQTRATKKK